MDGTWPRITNHTFTHGQELLFCYCFFFPKCKCNLQVITCVNKNHFWMTSASFDSFCVLWSYTGIKSTAGCVIRIIQSVAHKLIMNCWNMWRRQYCAPFLLNPRSDLKIQVEGSLLKIPLFYSSFLLLPFTCARTENSPFFFSIDQCKQGKYVSSFTHSLSKGTILD